MSDAIRSLSQYSVSRASLSAIASLCKKFLRLCPDLASAVFAPILVPERNSWLARILATPGYSLRYLHNWTIRVANLKVRSAIGNMPKTHTGDPYKEILSTN